ncbi:MAG TPA: nickel pincer cofactor biosynthesis protein LarC [Acidimicrobiales bacterium]|nr:nickel pincer cofactor biosynthesis protein LarC [Acidimicrobiales bacterium]
MTTTAWFHCFAGIAGDMALGALVDAGADLEEVLALVRRVPVDGWEVEAEAVTRNGVAATRVVVRAPETAIVRTHAHIRGLLAEARLPGRVLDRALAVFGCLAEAEGRLHRRPAAQVHFHEVGGVDAIVDIVGTCAALEVLGVGTVTASRVATGTGMVRSAHGVLPNPAPAVVELLRGAPTYGVDVPVELTTPTGAALLAALCTGFGPLPEMVIAATGFGAGTRTLEHLPNVTQVVVGAPAPVPADGSQPLVELAANVDDATGETIAYAIAALLDAGALDAWVTPVLMKKGRPGHVVSALADEALAPQVSAVLLAETGTLGARARRVDRVAVDRSTAAVSVEGARVRVKVSPGRVKAEHDDAARVARLTGLPAREVARRAEDAWRASWTEDPA